MIHGEMLDEQASCQSVLVLESGLSTDIPALLDVSEPAKTPLLVISFSSKALANIDSWEHRLGFRPVEVAAVTTQHSTPSSVAEPSVSRVSSPSDMTGIGMAVTEQLADWDSDEDERYPLVLVDSLTILLQYTSVRSLYRFLHTLTVRLQASDARGLFLLDPLTQDDKTVYTFASLFDAIAKPVAENEGDERSTDTSDGEADHDAWTIRTR